MAADDGARVGAPDRAAVEAWTDAALDGLPPGAALLVRAKPFADRLRVAQAVEGRRDDVLVVPLGSVAHGRVAASLIAREPALAPLVHDQALYATPGEYALASLASVRPLYAEGGPRPPRRAASHAAPEALWLRLWPQPVGATERRAGQAQAGRAIDRVLAVARAGGGDLDAATRRALVSHLVDELTLALALDERELIDGAWATLGPLDPDGAWLPDDGPRRPGDLDRGRRRARR
jgi:hypothetical protein